MTGLARRVVTAAVYGAIVLLALFGPWPTFLVLTLALFALGVSEIAVLHRGRSDSALAIVLGAAYVGLGLWALVFLWGERDVNTPEWLLLAVIPTWAADIASYAVGSTIGRRAIAPRVSPRKTWEGTLGGFAAAAITALVAGAAFGLPAVATWTVAIGLGPVAFAGDLLESWMKRRVGAKDSGSILPGHGGILDRIDSLLAVGPLVALVLLLAGGLG